MLITGEKSLEKVSAGESGRRVETLGFTGFLRAHNMPEAALQMVSDALGREVPVHPALHSRMTELLSAYAVVGAVPEVLETFLTTHNIPLVRAKQRAVLRSALAAFARGSGPVQKMRLKDCVEAVPRVLMRDNKKFRYADIRQGGRAERDAATLEVLEAAGLIRRSCRVTDLALPVEAYCDQDCFKVYFADPGFLMCMLPRETAAEVLSGNLFAAGGAVAESLAADLLTEAKRPLCYFRRKTGLEAQLLTEYRGRTVPVAVRPASGNAKALKTLLSDREIYGFEAGLEIGVCNVERRGRVVRLPFYALAFFG